MFTPGNLSVQMYTQVFYVFSLDHVFFFRVKATWTDFVSFNFIRHFFNHNWILFKCICSLCVGIAGSSCVFRMAVSSTKVAVVLSAVVGSQLCKVHREMGQVHCPVARQIEPCE
jgi:hypothetical protein